jgi:hypothetical protein
MYEHELVCAGTEAKAETTVSVTAATEPNTDFLMSYFDCSKFLMLNKFLSYLGF